MPAETKSKQDNKRQPLPSTPPASWFIVIVPLISIALGLSTFAVAVRGGPHQDLSGYRAFSASQLRQQLGGPDWLFEQHDESFRLLYILNLVFKQLCSTRLGRGLFTAVMAAAIPPLGALMIEGLKYGSSPLLGPVAITIIVSLGQVIMIACASNTLLVPLFAFVSWRAVNKRPRVVQPLPSPPSSHVNFTGVVLGVSALPYFATMMVSPESGKPFFWASTAFQFFPLFWIPLWFVRKQPSSPANRLQEPRLAAARFYSLLAYVSVPLWWYALYNAAPILWSQWRHKETFPDDITRIIFYDTVSVCGAFYAIVLLQAEVDLRAVQLGAQRVHRARLFIEDLVFGSSGILLLGPGFGMGTYFARREVLAEKARFGIVPDLGIGVDSVSAARNELDEARKEQ